MKIALKADNGMYVCSDSDGVVRANRTEVGAWETFTVLHHGGGVISLQDCRDKWLCAEGGGGGVLAFNRDAAGPWESFTVYGSLEHALAVALQTNDADHFVCAEVGSKDPVLNASRTEPGGWETFAVEVLEADKPGAGPAGDRTPRAGSVVQDGKAVRDGSGRFHPLGMTLFWAVYGYLFEPDRIRQTDGWLAAQGIDFRRLLVEVDWDGRRWDPRTPGFRQALAQAIDEPYEKGVRTQLTLQGGIQYPDPDGLVGAVVDVVADGRRHKVICCDMVNEWENDRKSDVPTMQKMAARLRQAFPDMLIALSQPRRQTAAERKAEISKGWDEMNAHMKACGANLFVEHTDRNDSDYGWRQVRQGYDFKETPFPGWHNEPPGPQASAGGHNDNALQLAMMRAVGIICGAPGYVLHAAQGVTGLPNPKYNRPEWIWQVPHIEACIRALRNVDAVLPEGVETWRVVNNGSSDSSPHPLRLDSRVGVSGGGFWAGDKPGSVNKNYAAVTDSRFVVALCGVKSDGGPQVVGKAKRACHVRVYDPVSGSLVDERDLSAGTQLMLPGRPDTMAGYIVVGDYR